MTRVSVWRGDERPRQQEWGRCRLLPKEAGSQFRCGEGRGGRGILEKMLEGEKGGETYKPKKMTFIFTAFFLNQLFFEV